MKKLFTTIIAVVLLLSAAGCGNNAELEALKKENEELRQQAGITETSADSSNNTDNPQNAPASLVMGEPFEVPTEYGTYKITLLSAARKDWRARSYGDVKAPTVVISYEVENVDFSNEYYAGCYVDSSIFYIYDDNKLLLDFSSVSYDVNNPDTVLPGHKGRFDVSYDLTEETENVEIILHRSDKDGKDVILGQVTAKVEQ